MPQHSWAPQLSDCIPAADKPLHIAPSSLLSPGEPPTPQGWDNWVAGPAEHWSASQRLGPAFLLIPSPH